MEEGRKGYSFYELENLSEVEKDIILVLGKNNRREIIKFNLGSNIIKFSSIKKELKKKYTNKELFTGLTLLIIKQLIIIGEDPYDILRTESNLLRFTSENTSMGYDEDTAIFLISLTLKNLEYLIKEELIQDEFFSGHLKQVFENNSNNLSDSVEDIFNDNRVMNSKYIYLTYKGGGITGTQIYNDIVRDNYFSNLNKNIEREIDKNNEIQEKINELNRKLDAKIKETNNEIDKKAKDTDEKINQHLSKNIEIISIFVAIITLIIGNVSFIPQISGKGVIGTVSIILVINGVILTGVSLLLLFILKILKVQTEKNICTIILISLTVALLVFGIGLPIADKYVFKIDVQTEQNTSSTEIQNGLTIENNVNATNEGAQPAITKSPEVSSSVIVQPTPIPTPTPTPN